MPSASPPTMVSLATDSTTASDIPILTSTQKPTDTKATATAANLEVTMPKGNRLTELLTQQLAFGDKNTDFTRTTTQHPFEMILPDVEDNTIRPLQPIPVKESPENLKTPSPLKFSDSEASRDARKSDISDEDLLTKGEEKLHTIRDRIFLHTDRDSDSEDEYYTNPSAHNPYTTSTASGTKLRSLLKTLPTTGYKTIDPYTKVTFDKTPARRTYDPTVDLTKALST